MQNRKMGRFLAMIMAVLLAACGGGGSSDGPVVSTATFQTRTALSNSTQDTRSSPFQVTGTISGINVAGSGIVTESPVTSTTFEGKSALRKLTNTTMELTRSGQSIPLSWSSASYFDSNYNPMGYVSDDAYVVMSNNVTIPNTARVNDTGVLYTASIYLDSSKTTLLGTETASYVLAPDTASTALLKITTIEKDTSGNTVSTSTAAYRITPAGDITLISEKFLSDGDVLNFAY